ncbi:MAG: threonine ammonia-lyase [Candidatus Sumerlaeota bacterium]|nr:threonine ammonia-lyase [Candidatus Sumerlaeota bacterium]
MTYEACGSSAQDFPVRLEDIQAAAARLSGKIWKTPLERSDYFSSLAGREVASKMENTQRTGSFKPRGALNKILSASQAERARGFIAASAGNHAQGMAHAGRVAGADITIVMPEGAPINKIERTRRLGARVILHGHVYDECQVEARRLAETEGLIFVSAFDDPTVIAGQGTIGLEILEQWPDVDTIIVPIGGGGLIAGIAIAVKALAPRVRIVGVEPTGANAFSRSLRANASVTLPSLDTFADGVKIKTPGAIALRVARSLVDEVVEVDDEETARAVLLYVEEDKSVVEGAGALPLAALLSKQVGNLGRNVCLVVSGGNIDVNLIARIINQGLAQSGRLARIRFLVSDRPGMLARLAQMLGELGANILEVQHNRAFGLKALDTTEIVIVVETLGERHIRQILRDAKQAGFEPALLK